jgi:hypothetical protein
MKSQFLWSLSIVRALSWSVSFQCEKATFNPGNVCFGRGMQETVEMNKCHRGNITRTWYIWKAETRWTDD